MDIRLLFYGVIMIINNWFSTYTKIFDILSKDLYVIYYKCITYL